MQRQQMQPLTVEHLEERALLSAVVLESEPNNRQRQADFFTFGADGAMTLQGRSANSADKDFFAFVAPADGTLSIDVQAPGPRFAKLQIENRAGVSLFETQPNNGVNSGDVTLTAGQTYFIRLRAPGALPAAYLVDLVFTGAGAVDPGLAAALDGGPAATANEPGNTFTETEPNDRESTANTFDLGGDGFIQLLGTSVNSNDKDFFRFRAAQSGVLTVAVAATNGRVAKMELTDALGNRLAETQPNNGVNTVSVAVTAGQSYLLRLRAADAQPAAYQVSVTLA